jgi:ABC-type Na+ efflux pump permease subunit
MTFLPLVERELRVAARRISTYRIRTLAAGLVTLVAMAMLLFGVLASSRLQVGKAMFHTLSYIIMALCFLEGVRKTADCLSEERREGTLGLLFLTDLKGYDVVFGKLVAASLNSFYCLFALLPILALSLLLGGVTISEFWRMALALANILFFSLSVGTWVSANSRLERRAMIAALLLIVLPLSIHLVVPGSFIYSPACPYYEAFETTYRLDSTIYWKSLLIIQAASWSLLVWASLALPRRFQDEFKSASISPWRRRWSRWQLGTPSRRAQLRAQMLDVNPAFWLAGRNLGQRLLLWISVVGLAGLLITFVSIFNIGFLPAYLSCSLGVNFLLKTWIASQACHCLAEARRNNALEMLLSTPLTVDQIIRGQILSLRRIFLLPILIILGLEIAGLAGGIYLLDKHDRAGSIGFTLFFGLLYLGMFILDIVTLAWTGMWFGLSSKNETTAIVKTILYILVLPVVAIPFWCFGIVFYIGWPIFWIIWSTQKLRSEFRNLAAQRYIFKPQESRWLPFISNQPSRPPVPPLIYTGQ